MHAHLPVCCPYICCVQVNWLSDNLCLKVLTKEWKEKKKQYQFWEVKMKIFFVPVLEMWYPCYWISAKRICNIYWNHSVSVNLQNNQCLRTYARRLMQSIAQLKYLIATRTNVILTLKFKIHFIWSKEKKIIKMLEIKKLHETKKSDIKPICLQNVQLQNIL